MANKEKKKSTLYKPCLKTENWPEKKFKLKITSSPKATKNGPCEDVDKRFLPNAGIFQLQLFSWRYINVGI